MRYEQRKRCFMPRLILLLPFVIGDFAELLGNCRSAFMNRFKVETVFAGEFKRFSGREDGVVEPAVSRGTVASGESHVIGASPE